MFAALKRFLIDRDLDNVIEDSEALALDRTPAAVVVRHAALLERARAAGLDPNTLALLISVFGPLILKLIERWLAKRTSPTG